MELGELKKLIAQGESLKVDFKRDLHPSSIQDLNKDIAAFANTEGGYILVGVENNRTVIGVDWNAEKSRLVYDEGMNCLPQISVNIHQVSFPRAGTVVAIEVPKSTYIHRDSNKRFPQRLGDSTLFMDTNMLISLARSKGLYEAESGFLNRVQVARKRPKKVAFLTGYLNNPKPMLRAESLTDLGNAVFNYAIEDMPKLSTTVLGLLGDKESSVRLAALNLLSNLNFRWTIKKKAEYRAIIAKRVIEMVYHDEDVNVRTRALSVLADLASPKIADAMIKLALTEPADTYPKFNFQNVLMRLGEAGLGYKLAEQLYVELAKVEAPDKESRLKELLGFLRNTNWAR